MSGQNIQNRIGAHCAAFGSRCATQTHTTQSKLPAYQDALVKEKKPS